MKGFPTNPYKMFARSFRFCISFFLLVVFTSSICLGQTSSTAQKSSGKQPIKNSEKDAQLKTYNLNEVKEFVNRAFSFGDASSKVGLLSLLADLFWDVDQAYARDIFLKTLNLLNPDAPNTSNISERERSRLRKLVLSFLSTRDPQLAKKYSELNDETNNNSSPAANAMSALNLLSAKDSKGAINAIQSSISLGYSPGQVYFIKELRSSNPALANHLFASMLNQMAASNGFSATNFLFLGTFLFTSRSVESSTDIQAVSQVSMNGIPIYDIGVDRENISGDLARLYVIAGNRLIKTVSDDPKVNRVNHFVGISLLPKARRFAPDFISSIEGSIGVLSSKMNSNNADESIFKEPDAPYEKLKEVIGEIEKLSGDDNRNIRFVALAHRLWLKNEYEGVNMVVGHISDLEVRSSISVLNKFRQLSQLIKSDGVVLDEIDRKADTLPAGIEKVLLKIQLAQKYGTISKGESLRVVDEALALIRKLNEQRTPFLFLACANLLSKLEEPRSKFVVDESVQNFNKFKSSSFESWNRDIKVGKEEIRFKLDANGISTTFRDFKPLIGRMKIEDAISITRELNGELHQAVVMGYVAQEIFKQDSIRRASRPEKKQR